MEHRRDILILPLSLSPPSSPGFASSKWKIPAVSWVMHPFLPGEPQTDGIAAGVLAHILIISGSP